MPTIEDLERGLQPPDDARFGGPDLGTIRRQGRRRRLRHRVLAAGAGTVVAGALVASVLAVPGLRPGGGEDQAPQVATAPTGQQELLDQCRTGESSKEMNSLLFGPGPAAVKAVERNAHQVRLALESADGQYWGDCFVNLDSQEFSSGLTVYPTTGHSAGTGMGYGPGCGLVDGDTDPTCSTFWVAWVDRRPAQVAAARVVTADGRTTTVTSQDGYLVLNYLGDLPEGTSVGSMGLGMNFQPVSRITFLDADGDAIAAQAMDGSGTGEDHERVGDLPTLDAFPGTYGDPVY